MYDGGHIVDTKISRDKVLGHAYFTPFITAVDASPDKNNHWKSSREIE